MIGKTSVLLSLLLLCVVFVPARSDPLRKNAEDRPPALNRQKRTFGLNWFGSRDWPQFRQIWRLPSFPTVTGMSSFFDDDQLIHENFHKRISDLENGQRRIVNYLRKLKADKNANGASSSTTQLPERLPTPVADSVDPPAVPTNATGIAPEPQTPTAASATTTVETRLKDEKSTEATTTTINHVTTESTTSHVTTESTTSSDKFADKDVEAVTVPTTVSEETPKGADEETTVAPLENYDSEETNELFV